MALLAGDKKRYRELAKEARRLAKKKKADAAERLAAELDQARKEDPKRFWRTIKALGGLCRSSAITTEVQRQDGSKSADPKVVLEEFKNHFEKLHNEGHDATLFDKENFERIIQVGPGGPRTTRRRRGRAALASGDLEGD